MKEYFIHREKAVLPPEELDGIDSDAVVADGKLVPLWLSNSEKKRQALRTQSQQNDCV